MSQTLSSSDYNILRRPGLFCVGPVLKKKITSFVLANNYKFSFWYTVKKGKAIPLQAWTGPEGSRSLRLPDFKTFGT